jgi:hypothetical protein
MCMLAEVVLIFINVLFESKLQKALHKMGTRNKSERKREEEIKTKNNQPCCPQRMSVNT